MATRHLCLYRNKAIGTDRTAAKTALENVLKNANDGEIVINRYKDGDNIKVLIGFTTEDSTVKIPFVFDADAIPADVQIELNKITNGSDGSIAKAIEAAKNELVGSAGDSSTSNTITGAKKYTDSKIAGLNLTDNAVAKSFVTKVNQNNGKITIARGEVTSKDKTVKMTDGTDGGFDVAVNIDGTTIIKNASSGVLSVASGALTQYKGSNAVKVSEVDPDNNKTVSLSINSNDKVLTQSNDGLFANINLTWDNEQGLKLIGKDSIEIATIPAADFIKDGMLDNATYDEETHKITLTFNTAAGKQPIELNLSDLVDTYEAGNGLELTGKVFSIKKSAEADSEGFLKVGTDGIKVSGVQDAINTAAANYKNTIDNYTIGGAKISTNPVLTGEKAVKVNGLTIGLNLTTDSNLVNDENGLKLADTIDCGTYDSIGESGPGESGPGESGPGESGPDESGPGESGPGESRPYESVPVEA